MLGCIWDLGLTYNGAEVSQVQERITQREVEEEEEDRGQNLWGCQC